MRSKSSLSVAIVAATVLLAGCGGTEAGDASAVPADAPTTAIERKTGAPNPDNTSPEPAQSSNPGSAKPSSPAANEPTANVGAESLKLAAGADGLPDRFDLPSETKPIGSVSDENLVLFGIDADGYHLTAVDKVGAVVWASATVPVRGDDDAEFTVKADSVYVNGDNVYLLGELKKPGGGMSGESKVWAIRSFDVTMPDDAGTVTETTVPTPSQWTPPVAALGDRVVFRDGTTSNVVNLATGEVEGGTQGPELIVVGFTSTGDQIQYSQTDDTMTAPGWAAPIPVGTLPYGVSAPTQNRDGFIGIPTETKSLSWVDRAGTTVVTVTPTDANQAAGVSPNGAWFATADTIVNLATGTPYPFPAQGSDAAPSFFAVTDDGVAFTKGPNGNLVTFDATTGTTTDLGKQPQLPVATWPGWIAYQAPLLPDASSLPRPMTVQPVG